MEAYMFFFYMGIYKLGLATEELIFIVGFNR